MDELLQFPPPPSRPHQKINTQMPLAVRRASLDIEAAARPVDLPRRLDNENALPPTTADTEAARTGLTFKA